MTDPWQCWNTNPPPIVTHHTREGSDCSVQLVVIDYRDTVYNNVSRGGDGLCHCNEGGRIHGVVKWAYAPGAWAGVIIDKVAIEVSLIKRLQEAGYLPDADPELITNQLYDPQSDGLEDVEYSLKWIDCADQLPTHSDPVRVKYKPGNDEMGSVIACSYNPVTGKWTDEFYGVPIAWREII